MTRSLRRSMAWIHGWLGLLAGWILFAMFLTGTASYFRPEITRWMRPELQAVQVPPARAASAAVAHMQIVGSDDVQWYIHLPDGRNGVTRVFQQRKPAPGGASARTQEIELDPAAGEPIRARDTRGGEHFYRFHFQLQLPHPWGRWLAGLCAMFMLGAIISGVITHKRILADLFTLRWNKGQRSWLDAHNVSAVLALPYHAMVTYTGLITLVAMYMPWPAAVNYDGPAAFPLAASGAPPDGKPSGARTGLFPVAPLVLDAERRWRAPASRVILRHPNDRAATVTVHRHAGSSLNARGPFITYSGADGRMLSTSPDHGAAMATAGVMLGLHLAQFAEPALRWAYFVLGLTGTSMVGTGLMLWTAARRRRNAEPFPGLALVERLNIGVVAGLPIGIAAFLLSNRLLDADLQDRADTEVAAMFWTWGIFALAQVARPVRQAWSGSLGLGALLFALVPIVSAWTTARGLPTSIIEGDVLFVTFDMAMLVIAALLGLAAQRAAQAAHPPANARKPRRPIHA